METVGNKAIKGFAWKFFEKISYQVINVVIQIVLARLLMPEDYGIVALLTIFMMIGETFIRQGLTTAIIQKKDADYVDMSTVFWGNIGMSAVLYLMLYLTAPYIAMFYRTPELTSITRVMALNLVIGGFCAVHFAIISKRLEFQKSYIVQLVNVIVHGSVGIWMALRGYGAWALVYSLLIGTSVSGLVLFYLVKWSPGFMFSIDRIKRLFGYSSKVLGSNLLNTTFNNIHSLVIGRFFTSSSLAFYQRGQAFPHTIMGAVDGSFSEVMYPAYALIQDDIPRLRNAISRSLQLSMFICLPIMYCLCAMSENVTIILLTDKWIDSVPFMQLSCVICSFWPLSTITHAINAMGKSSVTFKINIISKSLILFFVFACIPFGVFAIMVGSLISSIIMLLISTHYYKKLIGYGLVDILKDLKLSFISAVVTSIIVFMMNFIDLDIYLKVTMQFVCGILVYLLISMAYHNQAYLSMVSILKNRFVH